MRHFLIKKATFCDEHRNVLEVLGARRLATSAKVHSRGSLYLQLNIVEKVKIKLDHFLKKNNFVNDLKEVRKFFFEAATKLIIDVRGTQTVFHNQGMMREE